jgi:hypothetical protein
VLRLTILEELTKGLRTIAENDSEFGVNGDGRVKCSFPLLEEASASSMKIKGKLSHVDFQEDKVRRNRKLKSKGGVKSDPWWTFIPIKNFIVPVLHILIGLFNDSFNRFHAIISD